MLAMVKNQGQVRDLLTLVYEAFTIIMQHFV
jgi:hypothetical protein